MARLLKGLLAGLTLRNIGVEITTYVRNDNSEAAHQSDSVNTATSEKRRNGFVGSNMGVWGNDWMGVGYIWGGEYIGWAN